MSDLVDRLRECARYSREPHSNHMNLANLLDEAATEILASTDIVEAARRWRRAYHHGVREEQDIQEQLLLDAVAALDNQQQVTERK